MSPEKIAKVISDVNDWLSKKPNFKNEDLEAEIICRIKHHYIAGFGKYGRLHFLKRRNMNVYVSNGNLHHVSIVYPYDDLTKPLVDYMNTMFRDELLKTRSNFNFDNIKNFKF